MDQRDSDRIASALEKIAKSLKYISGEDTSLKDAEKERKEKIAEKAINNFINSKD